MNVKDSLKYNFDLSNQVLQGALADFSDAELLVRPTEQANHTAWQLGHLISSEVNLLSQLPGAAYPALPANFAQQHNKETAGVNPPTGFLTKQQYFDLFAKVREATLALLDRLTEADLDRPNTGPLAQMAPTVGHLLIITGSHPMMHVGQITAVRRKLGKKVLF